MLSTYMQSAFHTCAAQKVGDHAPISLYGAGPGTEAGMTCNKSSVTTLANNIFKPARFRIRSVALL